MKYTIKGTVVRGDGYGRTLGFPTINLETNDNLPNAGVYKGIAELDNEKYRAGILINPTGKVEAYLLEFNQDIYGKTVTLELGKYLREYKKFDTEEELIEQIKKDIAQI